MPPRAREGSADPQDLSIGLASPPIYPNPADRAAGGSSGPRAPLAKLMKADDAGRSASARACPWEKNG